MERFLKPARANYGRRGYFSYITESAIHLLGLMINNTRPIYYYHKLEDISWYGQGNVYDVCFQQNVQDYSQHSSEYINIEDTHDLLFEAYELDSLNDTLRKLSEQLIKEYFIPNDRAKKLFNERYGKLDFSKIIGVHRRATDIGEHNPIVPLELLFDQIESIDFEYIILMCDNKLDVEKFKARYGDKLLCYETHTSESETAPFFITHNTQENLDNHLLELVSNVLALSKVKHLICTRSNVSAFIILANSKLKYTILK